MNKIERLMLELQFKYGSLTLSNRQAIEALGLSRGRELGAILYTDKLPSLNVRSIANFLLKKRSLTLGERLSLKYGREKLYEKEVARELALSIRECRALVSMGLLERSVNGVEKFLENKTVYQKLNSKQYIKKMYWDYKLADHEIGDILGVSYYKVRKLIEHYNLSKRKHNVKIKGKIGYKMPDSERVKHHVQRGNKAIVMCDIETLTIKRRYRGLSAVEEDGFVRQHVRKSAKEIRLAKKKNGRPAGIFGVCRGRWKFFFEDEYLQKRAELIEEIKREVRKYEMDFEETKEVFGESIAKELNSSVLMMGGE